MLDLRKPAGMFFGVLGLLLIITSFAAPDYKAPMTDVNLNLYFGVFCVLFGGVFLLLSRRA